MGEGVAIQMEQLGEKGEEFWPTGEEAWGELADLKEQLDIRGDFSNFIVWSKSGNPPPSEHKFAECPTMPMSFSPNSKFGTLKRSISRSSLRYRTCTTPVHPASRFPSMFSLRATGSVRSQRRSKSIKVSKEKDVESFKDSDKSETPVSNSPVDYSEDEVLRENSIQNDTLEEVGEELIEDIAEADNDNIEEMNETDESEQDIILSEASQENPNPFADQEEIAIEPNVDEKESDETPKENLVEEKTLRACDSSVGPPVHTYDDRKNPFMDELFSDEGQRTEE